MAPAKNSFVITGCNGGLGRALVEEFLKSPESKLYKGQFGVRNPSTATALHQVVATSLKAEEHDIITMDLSSLASVRWSANNINENVKSGKIPPIRALVLNAALQHTKGQTFTSDGLESNFAVNYLANYLLLLLLLPSMDREMGRVVFTSSWTHDPSHPLNGFITEEKHKTVVNDIDDLAKPKASDQKGDEYNAGMRRYGMSKTLMVLWMYELQRRLSASDEYRNLSVLGVDPGAMGDTELLRESPLLLRIALTWMVVPLTPLLNWVWPNGYFRTRAKSAHDVLVASFNSDRLGQHPKAVYLNGSEFAATSPETLDETKQKQLWDVSARLAGFADGDTPLNLR